MVIKYEPFNKEQGTFKNRSKTTTKPFPELNAEVLALVYNDLLRKTATLGTQPKEEVASREWKRSQELWKTFKTTHPERAKLVEVGDFGTLYADSIRHLAEITKHQEGKERTTEGKWVKYDKGSDGTALSEAILGYDTGWCIVGRATAQSYVDQGDFYVYFSYDDTQNATIPRAAISVTDLGVTEVRGVQPGQNLEPEMTEIVDTKLGDLPEGDKYHKKMNDMRKLTAIEEKTKKGEPLSPKDFRFLYEIDAVIDGFGYQQDPRIEELQEKYFSRKEVQAILPMLIRSQKYDVKIRVVNLVIEKPEFYEEELNLLAKDESPDVRRLAVEAMGKRPVLFADTLIFALKDESPDVRRLAVQAIEKRLELFTEALNDLAKDKSFHIRRLVVGATGKRPELFVETLTTLAKDENAGVKVDTMDVIANRPELFVEVLTALAKDEDEWLKKRAIKAMGKRPELFVEALTTLAKDENADVKFAAVEVMANRPELFVDALTTIVRDRYETQLSFAAKKALGDLLQSEPEVTVEELIKFTKDKRRHVRVHAIGEMEHNPEPFVDVLTMLAKGEDQDTKLAAVKVMATRPDLFVEALVALAEDSNYWIKSTVSKAMRTRPELFSDTV